MLLTVHLESVCKVIHGQGMKIRPTSMIFLSCIIKAWLCGELEEQLSDKAYDCFLLSMTAYAFQWVYELDV